MCIKMKVHVQRTRIVYILKIGRNESNKQSACTACSFQQLYPSTVH